MKRLVLFIALIGTFSCDSIERKKEGNESDLYFLNELAYSNLKHNYALTRYLKKFTRPQSKEIVQFTDSAQSLYFLVYEINDLVKKRINQKNEKIDFNWELKKREIKFLNKIKHFDDFIIDTPMDKINLNLKNNSNKQMLLYWNIQVIEVTNSILISGSMNQLGVIIK